MTFKTHYEPVAVTEAGELNESELMLFKDGSSGIFSTDTYLAFSPVAVYRPRPDTVLLTREEVEAIDWIAVDDPDKLLTLEGVHTFLVPVSHTNGTDWWDIITGYIDHHGAICTQVNEENSGWQYSSAMYYRPVGKLPDIPISKPTSINNSNE